MSHTTSMTIKQYADKFLGWGFEETDTRTLDVSITSKSGKECRPVLNLMEEIWSQLSPDVWGQHSDELRNIACKQICLDKYKSCLGENIDPEPYISQKEKN